MIRRKLDPTIIRSWTYLFCGTLNPVVVVVVVVVVIAMPFPIFRNHAEIVRTHSSHSLGTTGIEVVKCFGVDNDSPGDLDKLFPATAIPGNGNA
jgi:hypothetical protein